MKNTTMNSNNISKDLLMKNLFKFPKETLLFVKEVAHINEDLLLEAFIQRLLSTPNIEYNMYSLSEEKISSSDFNRFKRLDLALEFRTEEENLEFIIFIENQTTNDKTMVFRMLEYMTATMLEKLNSNQFNIERGLPRPVPILIYLGNDECNMPIQMEQYFKGPRISEAGVHFKMHLVDLGGKRYRQVMENTSMPSIFLQLMKALYTDDYNSFQREHEVLKTNLAHQEVEVAQYYKNVLGLLATDFVDYFSKENNINDKEVERMARTVREILDLDNLIINAQKEGMERGIEQGIEQGIERGIAQGLEQGRLQEKRQIIIAFLDILDDETIADRMEIDIDEVIKLRKQYQH